MRQLDLRHYVRNRDYSVWPIDFAISASFELPCSAIQGALPPGVHLLEPRPGLALLNIAVFHFTADTEGLDEACSEIVVSAHVLPNVSLAPTLPHMAMFTLRLASDSRKFIGNGFATDHYPVYAEPLDIRIDRERIAVAVFDARGAEVLQLAAAQGVDARYEKDRFYAQSFAMGPGGLHVCGNLFEFERAENQRHLRHAGRPHPHALFEPIDVSSVTADRCHIQMWSRPGTIGFENHFFLKPLAAVSDGARQLAGKRGGAY